MTSRTIIIAEAGVNHNGKISIAKKIIDSAKLAGADYVKFQIYETNEMCTTYSEKAKYQKLNSEKKKENQYDLLKRLELSEKGFKTLYNYCKKKKIKFLASCFDINSLHKLIKFKVDYIKIPSGEIDNFQLINEACKSKKKLILSTGMADLKEIKEIYLYLKKRISLKKLTILHCNSAYPTPDQDANLRVLNLFKKKFKCNIGYSDHTIGKEASLYAVALGASVIEKHITLNKKMLGPDHATSLNPVEFKEMVFAVRRLENFLGLEKKIVTQSEKINKNIVRKIIVAKNFIRKGEIFTLKNLSLKRAGNGHSSKSLKKIIGKIAKKNFKKDEKIKI